MQRYNTFQKKTKNKNKKRFNIRSEHVFYTKNIEKQTFFAQNNGI